MNVDFYREMLGSVRPNAQSQSASQYEPAQRQQDPVFDEQREISRDVADALGMPDMPQRGQYSGESMDSMGLSGQRDSYDSFMGRYGAQQEPQPTSYDDFSSPTGMTDYGDYRSAYDLLPRDYTSNSMVDAQPMNSEAMGDQRTYQANSPESYDYVLGDRT